MQAGSCRVCLESFSSSPPHRPKMLACGHTTCESCIQQWAQLSDPVTVQCPQCQRKFDGLAVDDVPINQGMLEMMEAMQVMEVMTGAKRKVGADKDASKKSKRDSTSSLMTCSEHSGQVLSIHCWSCSKAVCDRCALFGHKTHSYSEIHEAANRMQQKLEERQHEMEEMIENWKKARDDVEKKMTMIKTKEEEMLKMTDAICDEMREGLEEWREKMKKRVVDIVKQDEEKLKELSLRLEEEIGEGERMSKESEELIAKREEEKKKEEEEENDDEEEQRMDAINFLRSTGEMSQQIKTKMDEFAEEDDAAVATNIAITEAYEKEGGELMDDLERMKTWVDEGITKVAAVQWRRLGEDVENSKNITGGVSSLKEREKMRKMASKVFGGSKWSMVIDGRLETEAYGHGVAWANDGKSLYVTMEGSPGVRQINIADGRVMTTLGQALKNPGCVAVSKRGDVCVVNGNRVEKFSSISGLLYAFPDLHFGYERYSSYFLDGQLNFPSGICIVDEWNELFVADSSNHRIQVFNLFQCTFVRKFGQAGMSQGEFKTPVGIAVDASAGLVFVSDSDNHRIQVFNREGLPIRMFGERGQYDGQLQSPQGIALDFELKRVIVADSGNRCLSVFDYEGRFIESATGDDMKGPLYISRRGGDGRLAISCSDRGGIFFGGRQDPSP